MSRSIKVRKAEIRDILKASFPEYRGRTYEVRFTDKIFIYNTNWSGGSRNVYVAVATDGRAVRFNAPAPWDNPIEGERMAVPPDALIVEHCYFCGKDMGITIYANPCHRPKWLAAGA